MRILLLLVAYAAAAGAADLMELAPPGTKAVFGARVKGIVESPLFKDAAKQAPQLAEEWVKLVALAGFDPLHDIDEVLIAASGDIQKADGLVFLRGRFNVEKMATGAPLDHGVPLLGGGKSGNSVMALLDSENALMGDLIAVRAAIARRGQPSRVDAAVAARVQSLRERFDVWGFGEVPKGFGSTAAASAPQALDGVDRFEFGVRLTGGFEIAADLHSRTPKDAEKLAASLGTISAMLAMGGQSAPKFNLQAKDGSVKFSLAISQEEMTKMLAAARMNAVPATPPTAKSGPPVIIGGETPTAEKTPPSTDGGITVFVLPGKK